MSSPALNRILHALIVLGLSTGAATAGARESSHEEAVACSLDSVHDHVLTQYAKFGPLSSRHEYFGFVYRVNGEVASSVVRSRECPGDDRCTTNIARAALAIPKGAKILGEWHTHPLANGSRALSHDDLRGARRNRHIPCYQAYYSTPQGAIYAWNITQTSVQTAMATRMHLGNFRSTT